MSDLWERGCQGLIRKISLDRSHADDSVNVKSHIGLVYKREKSSQCIIFCCTRYLSSKVNKCLKKYFSGSHQ